MSRPKYSVIIPAYNAEKYLSNILKFKNSTNKNRNDIEFIIIDDGSSDKTFEILNEYQDIIFHSQKNEGVSKARNKGIEFASGEFILFLDADDNYSENIFNVLDSYIKDDTDILLFNYKMTGSNVINPTCNKTYDKTSFLKSFFTKEITTNICSICYRKKFITQNNLSFPIGYSFGEDIYFIINSISVSEKKIIYIPNVLFNYNFQYSNTVAAPININKIKVLDLYKSIKITDLKTNEYMKYFIQRAYIYLIKLAIQYGATDQATIEKLKEYRSILNEPLAIKPPIDFKLAKEILKKIPILFFLLIKTK